MNKSELGVFISLGLFFSSFVQAGAPSPASVQSTAPNPASVQSAAPSPASVQSAAPSPASVQSAAPSPASVQGSSPVGIGHDVFVGPEMVVPVRISNRDINRVHCSDQIFDATYSQEKPVKIMSGGDHNLYVKFLMHRNGDEYTTVADSVDLHVACGKSVYTMILYPHAMDSVTIRLENPADRMADVVREWGKLSVEDRIKRLVIAMWKDEIPTGFKRKRGAIGKGNKRKMFEDIDVEVMLSRKRLSAL